MVFLKKIATVYCTNVPCSFCIKMIINAGLIKIVYQSGYADPLARELLAEASLDLVQLVGDKQGEQK